jgi:hypothetical protein
MLKNFRDLLAILIGVVVFPASWILQGFGVVVIPEGVIGATIAIETLIAQFYFRKKDNETNTPATTESKPIGFQPPTTPTS